MRHSGARIEAMTGCVAGDERNTMDVTAQQMEVWMGRYERSK